MGDYFATVLAVHFYKKRYRVSSSLITCHFSFVRSISINNVDSRAGPCSNNYSVFEILQSFAHKIGGISKN